MRILACSDLHEDLDATRRIVAEAAGADVLVVAGDLGNKGQGAGPVLDRLKAAPCPVILVAGNHDRMSDLRAQCRDPKQVHLLHGQTLRLHGIPFFGLGAEIPRQNQNLWNFSLSEAQATTELAACPPGAVLVTHVPPKGICDRQQDGSHDGSTAVLQCLHDKRPRLHLCGHVHTAWGQSAQVRGCTVHNLGPTARFLTL